MTEYDYSPAAYERFLATQTRVSKWVSTQQSSVPQYSNPFTPRDSYVASTSKHQPPPPSSAPRNRNRSRDVSEPPEPRRGKTLPSNLSRPSIDKQRPQPSRSQTLPANHHRSTSQPPRARDPPHQHAYATPVAAPIQGLPQPPAGYNAVYRTYQPGPRGADIYLPPPRPGETYVIVPPHGRQIRIVPDKGRADVSRPNSRGSSARSPAKKGPPLLKRLLENLSPASARVNRSGSRSTSRRRSF